MKYSYKNKKQKNGQFSFVHRIRGFLKGFGAEMSSTSTSTCFIIRCDCYWWCCLIYCYCCYCCCFHCHGSSFHLLNQPLLVNTIENSRLLKVSSTSLLLKVISIQAILTWLSIYVVSLSTWALQASTWKCRTCLTPSKLLVATSWSTNHKIDLYITLRLCLVTIFVFYF